MGREVALRLGDVVIERCVDLDPFALPAATLLPGAALEVLRPHAARLAPDHVDFDAGTILLAVQSHVLRVDGRVVLVDTCVGEGKERPRLSAWHRRAGTQYLARLAALGLRPEDVDTVLCTHLHADHVGWNTRLEDGRWVPTFPRARTLIGEQELAATEARLAREPAGSVSHGAFADSVAPLLDAGRVELVAAGHALAPGVTIEALPGHTAGHVGLRVARGGRDALLCGDAVHSPVQVYRPEWSSGFDDDAAAARATRELLFAAMAGTERLLIPNHLREAAALWVRRRGDGGFEPEFCHE